MSLRRAETTGLVLSVIVSGAPIACGGDDLPSNEAIAVETTVAPLSVGALRSIHGSYGAGCTARSGSWSVRVSGTDPLANPALSVVTNNSACVLTLTSMTDASTTYVLASPIAMTTGFRASASAAGSGSSAFYVNAKVSTASFDSPFVVTLLLASTSLAATSLTATLGASSLPTVVAATSGSINDNLITLTKPTGTTQGMLMVASVASESNKTASLSGWTSVGHASNSQIGLDILYKVAGASEPSSYTFAMSGSTKSAGGIVTIRGASTSSPIDVIGAASSTATAPSITTGVANTLLLGCWGNIAAATSPPSGMTEQWDTAFQDKIASVCSTEPRATAGATGTRAVTGAGTNPLARLVSIRP